MLFGLALSSKAGNPACTLATANLVTAIMDESFSQYPDYVACGGYLYPAYLDLINAQPFFDYDEDLLATNMISQGCNQLYYATLESCADNGAVTALYQQCQQLQASIPNC